MNILLKSLTLQAFVSRSKTLLKRRKIHVKKRTISKKKLKQQSTAFNYARQFRTLQISKQLDRRAYPHEHVNELMDEIFYPDISLINEHSAEISHQSASQGKAIFEADFSDPIEEEISQNILPAELLEVYRRHKPGFEMKHYQQLFEKMTVYFINREGIKAKMERSWAKMNERLLKKNPKHQAKKYPHLFYDSQDIYQFTPWANLIHHYSLQIYKNIGSAAKAILTICKGLNSVPFQLYQTFIKQVVSIPLHKIEEMDRETCEQILKAINLKRFVKFPNRNVIDSVEEEDTKLEKLKLSCHVLCEYLLKDSECTSRQLATVMNCFRFKFLSFEKKFAMLVREPLLRTLNMSPFEKVVDYLIIYQQTKGGDRNLIQILKFDIFRKLPLAVSRKHLFRCFLLVRNQHIAFEGSSRNKVKSYELFYECAKSISQRYCGQNKLTPEQILMMIKQYFYNEMKDQNLLDLMANQLMKNRQILSLSELAHCTLKLKVLGYSSLALTKVVLQQYVQKFAEAKDRLKLQEKYLLTDANKDSQAETENTVSEETKIEENLIISIWLWISSKVENSESLLEDHSMIDQLIKIYPLRIDSDHPMIILMIEAIYKELRVVGTFWTIKHKPASASNRHREYNKFLNMFQVPFQEKKKGLVQGSTNLKSEEKPRIETPMYELD